MREEMEIKYTVGKKKLHSCNQFQKENHQTMCVCGWFF